MLLLPETVTFVSVTALFPVASRQSLARMAPPRRDAEPSNLESITRRLALVALTPPPSLAAALFLKLLSAMYSVPVRRVTPPPSNAAELPSKTEPSRIHRDPRAVYTPAPECAVQSLTTHPMR